MPVPNRPYRVLVVEDNPTDVLLIEEALGEHEVWHEMVVLKDGDEASKYLKHLAENSEPDLIILDLNLPKRDGFGVLNEYRASPTLSFVPIVILTSSDSPADRLRAKRIRGKRVSAEAYDLGGVHRARPEVQGDSSKGLHVPPERLARNELAKAIRSEAVCPPDREGRPAVALTIRDNCPRARNSAPRFEKVMRENVPRCRRGAGADTVAAGPCICADGRTLPGNEAGPGKRAE